MLINKSLENQNIINFKSFFVPALIGYGVLKNGTMSSFRYSSPFMTIQFCLEICKGQELTIALIRVEECHCESSREVLQLLPQHYCSNGSSCPGNPFQSCGVREKNIFSVYHVWSGKFTEGQMIGIRWKVSMSYLKA